jgi:hypothetical protein
MYHARTDTPQMHPAGIAKLSRKLGTPFGFGPLGRTAGMKEIVLLGQDQQVRHTNPVGIGESFDGVIASERR